MKSLVPPAVQSLLKEHCHSVLQLEMLLLLRERPQPCTAASLARDMRLTERCAQIWLLDLARRGFVAHERASYRYAPSSSELERLVGELAACYATAKYAVIELMFCEDNGSAVALANSFKLR